MRIGAVDEDGHARLTAQSLGEADVVSVAVGEHQTADVGERATELGQLSLQVVPVTGQPRVDESDPLGQVDQIGGDDVVSESMQVRCELHGRPFRGGL